VTALTTHALYALRDAQFREECDAMPWEQCDRTPETETGCDGCPAWDGLRARIEAKGQDERPDVRPAAGEDAP
jgi:hypothetical protein